MPGKSGLSGVFGWSGGLAVSRYFFLNWVSRGSLAIGLVVWLSDGISLEIACLGDRFFNESWCLMGWLFDEVGVNVS